LASWIVAIAWLALLSSAAGCRLIDRPSAASLLGDAASLPTSDDRMVLEVYFVRAPLADHQLCESIWADVDEQCLPASLRRTLSQHGFRVGKVGSQLPPAVEAVLQSAGDSPQGAMPDGGDAVEPTVTRQELHLRPHRRGEIVTSPVRDRLTVMTIENGELVGRVYDEAQGLLAVKCHPQGDGRVALELVPELRHGLARQRWVGDDGMFRLDAGQSKTVLEALTLRTELAPGQMLVLGPCDQPPRSLGRDFLCDEKAGKAVQKLMVVRLVRSPFDDALTP
jgi:hypothetical protein